MSPSTGPPNEDSPLIEPKAIGLTASGDSLGAAAERCRSKLVACAKRILSDPEEAEDVVQEVMLQASQTPQSDVSSERGWLYAVTSRRALDRLRARRRREAAVAGLADSTRGSAEPSNAERRDEARRVRDAVATLDDPYRTALTLRYLEGLAFKEVAARMQTLERTARTWVGRGLCKLRTRLGGLA